MQLTMVLALCLAAVFINLPFGFYRQGVSRFSWRWFLAIHLPIPLVLALRISLHQSWRVVPFLFVFAIGGQFAGGILRVRMGARQATRPSERDSGPDPEKKNER